jgi:hypothetical protein
MPALIWGACFQEWMSVIELQQFSAAVGLPMRAN